MKNDDCFSKKHFNYNENFNLYSLKLNNEVAAKLLYEPNFNNSSLELKLMSKSGKVLSTLPIKDVDFEDFYIKDVEYVNSNTSSPELIINYKNHDPIICDLSPLWHEIDFKLDDKTDKVNNASSGDFAGLDSNGNLIDSGYKASDFVSKTTAVNGHVLSSDITLTKSDIGLGNVINTGDSDTPVNGGTTKFTTGGAYTELAKKINTSTIDQAFFDSLF